MAIIAEPLTRGSRSAPMILTGGGTALAAALVAFLVAQGTWQLALAAAALPLLALGLAQPGTAALGALALLPWSVDLTRGLPLKVSAPDLLLAVAFAAVLLRRSVGRPLPKLAAIQPVLRLVLPYAAILFAVALVHLSLGTLINSAQRLQLVLMPLVIGAVLQPQALRRGLALYTVSCCLLALAWMANVLPLAWGLQKNPVGQFLVGGILVALAFDVGRTLRWCAVPLLSVGLLATGSRGALLGLLVGLMVLLIAQPGLTRLRLAVSLVPLAAGLVLGYTLLPDDVQERTTTFSSAEEGVGTSGQFTIQIREAYREDALDLIASRPLTGVGIGGYLAGDPGQGDLTNDPHNFLLLEAAEGGLVLAGALVVLLVSSLVIVFRRRRATPLAPLAVAVQVSLVAHGLVDVYWVRGTPVLGWLLVGAALAAATRREERT